MFLSLQTLPVEIVFRILDCLTDKELFLSASNVCQRWNSILSCYEKYQNLKQLDLSSNKIGDEDVRHLSAVLTHNKTLEQLDLSRNRITNEGAQHLSKILRHNKTLKRLDLYTNAIGDEGAQYLSAALQYNTTVTHLDIRHNKLSAEGRKYFDTLIRARSYRDREILWD